MKTSSSQLLQASGFMTAAMFLLSVPIMASAWTATPSGTQSFTTPGSHTFVVPANAGTITVEVWGGGQEAQAYAPFMGETHGVAGGTTYFSNLVVAGGGYANGSQPTGGGAWGGDVNIVGNPSIQSEPGYLGIGGSAPYGGRGGFAPDQYTNPSGNGQQPGGGGGNIGCAKFICWDRGGASGGYAKKTYAAGALVAGTSIPIWVGAGGSSGHDGDRGGDGMVRITWSGQAGDPPQPASSFTQSTSVTPNPSVGSVDTITTTIKNTGGATSAIIDIEVYQNGTKVGQKVFDGQSFGTNESHTYTYAFTVPAPGTYTVSIGVFKPGWAGLHTWFDQVASFTAGGGGNQALPIYIDALASGWENWSWGSTQNFSNAALVFSGTHSMKVTYNTLWAGLFLHTAGADTTGKTALTFAIAGAGSGGQQLQVITYDSGNVQSAPKSLSAYLSGGVIVSNTWKQVSIPLADIGAANKTISGILIQDVSGGVGASIYIDSMQIQ